MTYDGGIRVAKYDDYQLPYTAPWAIGAGAYGFVLDRGIVSTEVLQEAFLILVCMVMKKGCDDDER